MSTGDGNVSEVSMGDSSDEDLAFDTGGVKDTPQTMRAAAKFLDVLGNKPSSNTPNVNTQPPAAMVRDVTRERTPSTPGRPPDSGVRSLNVFLLNAQGLASTDVETGSSDPVVTLSMEWDAAHSENRTPVCGEPSTQKSSIKAETLNPR